MYGLISFILLIDWALLVFKGDRVPELIMSAAIFAVAQSLWTNGKGDK